MDVAEKSYIHGVWLQRKEVSSERYKEKRSQPKGAVCVLQKSADGSYQSFFNPTFYENKMFWEEQQRIRKGTSRNEEKVKIENSTMLVEKEAAKERWAWAKYFEGLLNVKEDGETEIVAECIYRI